MSLKVGIETSYWYDGQRMEESIRYIKECGFEAIDWDFSGLFEQTYDKETGTSFFDKSLEEVIEYYRPLKETMKANDLSFCQSHGVFPMYFQGEDKKNESLLRAAERSLEVCQYLNIPAMVLHPWTGLDMHKEDEIEINLSICRYLMPMAKKCGVKICLENLFRHQGLNCTEGACADAKEAVWYIDTLNAEAGEEVFGFCLDTGHANLLGKNLYQYITTLGKRLTVLHINDNMGVDDNHMIPYTQLDRQGNKTAINWENFIRGLKEIGYEGDLSFETFRGYGILPKECEKEGLQLICSIGRYFRKRILE